MNEIEIGDKKLLRVVSLIRAMCNGQQIKFPEEVYPFGMSMYGSIGYVYNEKIVDDIPICYLVQKCVKMSDDDWALIAGNITLNEIKGKKF
jgi:hypothetical protein